MVLNCKYSMVQVLTSEVKIQQLSIRLSNTRIKNYIIQLKDQIKQQYQYDDSAMQEDPSTTMIFLPFSMTRTIHGRKDKDHVDSLTEYSREA